jgi:hypothetical protein
MIQEVGVDVAIKRVLRVKARPDYEPLFSILDGLRQDTDRRFWIECLEAQENNRDIEAYAVQMSTGCRNPVTDVPQRLNNCQGIRTLRVLHFKSEIAQRELGDLGRGYYASRKPSAI